MRMSSEMFPFASHDVYGYSLEYADAELQRVGALAKSLSHRLTSHPGQFTQLGSPKEKVIIASVRDLECEFGSLSVRHGADGQACVQITATSWTGCSLTRILL
jgi:UV DNA damage repair endonuclease